MISWKGLVAARSHGATVVLVLSAVFGCDESGSVAPDVVRDAAADAVTGPAKCGSTPTQVVDYVAHLPGASDADSLQVEVPTIGVTATDLFYLVNVFVGGLDVDGYLMRVPIRGGAPAQVSVLPHGSSGLQALAVTPTSVVFGQALGTERTAGEIVSLDLDGAAPRVLATTTGAASGLAADSRNAYFVDEEATKSVPLAGGAVRTLAATGPTSITLAVVGQKLVMADYIGNLVSTVPVEGGDVTVIANDQRAALSPVECGAGLCWLAFGASLLDGMLMRLASDASAPAVLAQGIPQALRLLFAGETFFVTTGGLPTLLRIPAAGGTPVFTGYSAATAALDESCLYWASMSGIYSLARSAAAVASGA